MIIVERVSVDGVANPNPIHGQYKGRFAKLINGDIEKRRCLI